MNNATEAMAPNCTMKRPAVRDTEIVRQAAEIVAVKCAQWGNDQPSKWIDALIDARSSWNDGYELARELENSTWITPDRDLVEILDDASHELFEVHRDAVKKWVRIVGFSPAYSVGDVVSCRHGSGPITKIESETAQFIVSTTDRDWGLGGGYVINAEDVAPVSETRTQESTPC